MAEPPRAADPELVGIENAILDLLVRVEDRHLDEMGLDKGIMKLVTAGEQEAILDHVLNRDGEVLQPEIEAGGSCANVLRAASLLGVATSYSSAVAADDTGRLFERGLNASRVRNRLAHIDGVTGTSVVLVTPDGERTMNTHLGVCRQYRPEHVPEDDIRRSRIFFTTGYIWDTPNQIDAIEHAIAVARRAGARLAIDLADPFAVGRSRDHLMRHKEHGFDILFANAEEARMMTGLGPEAAARELARTIEVVAGQGRCTRRLGAPGRRSPPCSRPPGRRRRHDRRRRLLRRRFPSTACCGTCRSAPAARSESPWRRIRSRTWASSCRPTSGNGWWRSNSGRPRRSNDRREAMNRNIACIVVALAAPATVTAQETNPHRAAPHRQPAQRRHGRVCHRTAVWPPTC